MERLNKIHIKGNTKLIYLALYVFLTSSKTNDLLNFLISTANILSIMSQHSNVLLMN